MTEENDSSPRRRPHYQRVRDKLVEQIRDGIWAPGQAIPSEPEIAREFRVSTGTARTAITMLANDNVVVRRHGRGTFVFEHTPEDELSRFFRLFDAARRCIGTDGQASRVERAIASRTERRELNLAKGSKVLRIARLRARDGAPFAVERISLPEELFPDLADRQRLPNTLYELYQKSYGVHVTEVEERLTAVAADAGTAKALGTACGTPLLQIERLAIALGGKPVEWRVSLCNLADARYITRLK